MTDPVAHTPSDSAGAPDVDKLVETLREKADLFVRPGFRDEDGVWHDGPHRIEFDAALSDLAATALDARQAAVDYQKQSSEQADEAASWRTRAQAAEADRDNWKRSYELCLDERNQLRDRVAELEARAGRAEQVLNELSAKPYRVEEEIAAYIEESRLARLAGDGGGA